MAADSRPKSLRDLVYNHQGFLVNPLQWTSRHLDLVGCRFEDSTRNEDRNDNHGELCPKSPRDAEGIARGLSPAIKRHHLINILVGEGRSFSYHR